MTPDLARIEELLAAATKGWTKFQVARQRMNDARPDPVFGTPAERAVYQERYCVDQEAEREHHRTAILLAQHAFDILARLRAAEDEVERLRAAAADVVLDAEEYGILDGRHEDGSPIQTLALSAEPIRKLRAALDTPHAEETDRG